MKQMIHSISGRLELKRDVFVVVNVHGVAFKINMPSMIIDKLPNIGSEVKILTHLHVREDDLSLFGFSNDEELELFEALISVSGIGPKSAISVMAIAPAERIVAAISHGETDLLQKVSGIGKKSAERIILELKEKLVTEDARDLVSNMEADDDVFEALVSMGYTQKQAKNALTKINPELKNASERLKEALRIIKS